MQSVGLCPFVRSIRQAASGEHTMNDGGAPSFHPTSDMREHDFFSKVRTSLPFTTRSAASTQLAACRRIAYQPSLRPHCSLSHSFTSPPQTTPSPIQYLHMHTRHETIHRKARRKGHRMGFLSWLRDRSSRRTQKHAAPNAETPSSRAQIALGCPADEWEEVPPYLPVDPAEHLPACIIASAWPQAPMRKASLW